MYRMMESVEEIDKYRLRHCCEWKLTIVDPKDRNTWRSAMHTIGRGPTDVDDTPAPAC